MRVLRNTRISLLSGDKSSARFSALWIDIGQAEAAKVPLSHIDSQRMTI